MAYAGPVVARLNGNGEIVRIRVRQGVYSFDGTLDIRYATPGDTFAWSSNTITEDALAGGGVDLFVNGNAIDAFWIDNDAITIRTAHSADGGHTWGASSTVATLPGQGLGVTAQLCCPMANVLVFSDSTIGQDESGNPMTGLYLTVKVGGVWNTPTLWDLGGQHMGVESNVVLPNGATYPSNLSGISLDSTRIELSYYANELRDVFEAGVWTQRIANVDTANATQHLHFGHPKQIFTSVAIDDDNNSTQMFAAFPRLQLVGSEYWIVALESSSFAGHERYHLAFFRSTDGRVWSDRDYHQGAANDEQEGAYLYTAPGPYGGPTPFLLTDLIYANLIVTATRTFIVGFDKTFFCPSTTLVGQTNPAKQLDLTEIVSQWSVNLPAAPTAATSNITIQNVPKVYDETDIISAHRGVRILHKAGYYTGIAHGDELIDVGPFWIDAVSQHTEAGVNNGSIQGIDNTMLLDRWKSDLAWEYFGPNVVAFDQFCDLTPFIVTQGSFTTSPGGILRSGIVNPNDNFRDDIAALNLEQTGDVFATFRFRCDRTWGGTGNTKNHMGFVFGGRNKGDGNDNKIFWAILYNRTTGRFTLNQAIPRPNVNRVKLYKYKSFVQESGNIVLAAATWYWMKVAVWHGHVMAWYGTDGINWTNVIDYTSPASPVDSVMPCRIGWCALVGTQRIQPSGAIGQLSAANGQQDLSDGASHPRMVALHIQLGNQPSILRRVNVAITQENTNSDPMPDASILILSGNATTPDDATDEDNVIFGADASALNFSSHNNPRWRGANGKPNPHRIRFTASQDIWVAVTFNDDLVAGQSYKWSSAKVGGHTTKYSDDGGATWNSFGDATLELCASIEVEYLNGRIKFSNLYLGTGENVQSYEELSHQIAAKSGVLDISPFDFLSQSAMVLGADNIYWQPASYGKIGDLVLDVDVAIASAPYTQNARVYVGSSTVNVGDTNGYIIELDPTAQAISFYAPGPVLIGTFESVQYIPLNFHLQVVNQDNFLYVYVNECLAAVQHDGNLHVAGYVGVDNAGAAWTNLRIPDLHQLVSYFSIDAKETAMSALQKLVAKPAPGTIARAKFFIRYDGSLRIGTFPHRVEVDQYQDTLFSEDKSETGRYVVSQLTPQGNYYATRWNGTMLDSDGRWFDQKDYTDARSDDDAYAAAAAEFVDAQEKRIVPSLESIADFAAEREDVVLVVNPEDNTGGDWVINDLTWTVDSSPATSRQKMGLRKFVS